MKRVAFVLGLAGLSLAASASELRTWSDRKGNRIEAEFIKLDGGNVLLKTKEGRAIPAKLENLCEADQAFVRDATYVPREVVATFRRRPGGLYEEVAGSSAAAMRDTVTLRLAEEAGDSKRGEGQGDSRWRVLSVDALGNRIVPRKTGEASELVTEGKFVFVTYSVENDSNFPITVPPSLVGDARNRKYLPVERSRAVAFVPDGMLVAGGDMVQPGFKKTFCGIYEMPQESTPAFLEVFPCKTSPYAIERFEGKGKQIALDGSPAPADAKAAKAPAPAVVSGTPQKVNLFLAVRKTKQGGDTRSDYTKIRSYTCQVDVRLVGADAKQVPVTLKVFFTGVGPDRRDLVVDRAENELVLEPGKIKTLTFQSKEIRERRSYFYYFDYSDNTRKRIAGAQLNGVIVQAWVNGERIKSESFGDGSLQKYEELADVAKTLGELKEGIE